MARQLDARFSKTMTDGVGNIPTWQPVRAARGFEISSKGWQQEAALRMLMNSVDRDVAEAPASLTPCVAWGKVAADWNAFRAIADALRYLASDATLLLEDGKAAGTFSTSTDSARVLIVDSDPAASWLTIGPQLFLPESYEILDARKRRHCDGDLRGRLIVAQSVSFEGAALSFAALMHGAAFLGIDADPDRIKRYVKTGYCDVMVNNLDEALRILKNAVRKREPASVGLTGNPDENTQVLVSRGVVPDWLMGRATFEDEPSIAPEEGEVRAAQELGSILLPHDDGATISCVALSGEPSDIQRVDRLLLELFPEDEPFVRQIRILQRRLRYQGLPARALWLSGQACTRLGTAVNQLVGQGELKAPMVIGRLARSFNTVRTSKEVSVKMPAESLDELLPLTRGASWASIAHNAEHQARVVAIAVVADGSNEASARIERALTQNISPG